ncbi:MAG: putative thio:disulfide interchange protein [Hyphomicrobiales bacterium]|nr:putative thio:disulfide interchange protein [Hyphomicrobiales bacterium]
MRNFIIFATALLLTTPAFAAATDWQEVAPGVRLRLIADNVLKPDGTTLAGIEIDMPKSTKTYWRVPGESGIPTELDLAGSAGVVGHAILWPFPTSDTQNGFRDYVYYGPTVLPVSLKIDAAAATLQAAILMGVCSDVCVPVRASFALPLAFGTPDAGQRVRLAQAVATTPIAWDGAPNAIGLVRYDGAARALIVPVTDPQIDPASLIADAGPGGQLFGAPQKSPDGQAVLLPLLGTNDEKGLESQAIRLTFMTAKGPYELSRKVTVGVVTPAG